MRSRPLRRLSSSGIVIRHRFGLELAGHLLRDVEGARPMFAASAG
jgi:hypothetical protein